MRTFSFALFLLFAPLSSAMADNTPCSPSDFPTVYTVFGGAVTVCATAHVPEPKVLHATAVVAEWLDNDNDGRVDNNAVVSALRDNRATLIMHDENDEPGFFMIAKLLRHTTALQNLYTQETNPANGRRDASGEEIHHLIMNAGFGVAYPDVFSENKSSQMHQIYAHAEQNGHYYYPDPTCTAQCKSTEFHYLATAVYLGSEADHMGDEIRLHSRAELQKHTPKFIPLITNPKYQYPHHKWPTGTYTANPNAVVKVR